MTNICIVIAIATLALTFGVYVVATNARIERLEDEIEELSMKQECSVEDDAAAEPDADSKCSMNCSNCKWRFLSGSDEVCQSCEECSRWEADIDYYEGYMDPSEYLDPEDYCDPTAGISTIDDDDYDYMDNMIAIHEMPCSNVITEGFTFNARPDDDDDDELLF